VKYVIWAAEPDQLLELTGHPVYPKLSKGGLVLFSALVRPDAVRMNCSTMLIPGDFTLPFRVTNQSYAAGLDEEHVRISCEWSASLVSAGVTVDVEQRVRSALEELRIISTVAAIREARIDVLKEVLPAPDSR
jgi:hypothetical protein